MANSTQKNSKSAFVSANPDICIDLTKATGDEDEDGDGNASPEPTSDRSNQHGQPHSNHRGLVLHDEVVVAVVSSGGESSPSDNEPDDFEATDDDDAMPMLKGKYPRLTSCPSSRAPRNMKHIIRKAQVAKTVKAQRKRVEKSRKAHRRFSPVPLNNESPPSKQSRPAMWPKTSLALRPKSTASGKMKEK